MSALAMGERIRVYIQRGDGEVQEISGRVTQIETYQNSDVHRDMGGGVHTIPTTVETRLTVIGTNYSIWSDEELVSELALTKTALEWRCDHCQAVNLRKHRMCDSCGFPRPFLYGSI